MKPFEYQEEFIHQIGRQFARRNKRVVGCAITGFGKTVVGANLALRSAMKGNVVCILVHRIEIFNAFARDLGKLGVHPAVIIPGHNPMPGHQVYLGMVETFSRRMKKDMIRRYNINFFMLDEVHWGSYPKVIQELDCHILGFSATPKTTGKPELNTLFDEIVVGANVQELIAINRLVNGKTFSVKHDFTGVKKKGKDFEEKALLEEFKKAKLYDGAVKKYLELCPNRKAICYCVNVEHALDTLNQFKSEGIRNLYHVDGEDCYYSNRNGEIVKGDRDEIFKSFEADDHAVLTNVGVATTGYDCPSVSCIIENFATMSITKHHQVIGRGARVCEGKEDFYIIDMGRNWLRFGRYGQVIDWAGIFHKPDEGKAKDPSSMKQTERECDECAMLIPMRQKICPFCGDITSDKEIEKILLSKATVEEIKQHRLDTLPLHLRKSLNSMEKHELVEFGKHMNYKPGWAFVRWQKMLEFKQRGQR